jgi:ubiquinone/menaquinone biosynthesis C-methylase UbiE
MSVWDAGSYERTADRLQPAADVLVASLGLPAGARVLDVGCGTGNAALAAARADHDATGVDSAERLVAVARERATAEGLAAHFDVGDATALPYEDAAFDAAVSVFGVIFADPPAAAAELLRVTRPGGRVVFTTCASSSTITRSPRSARRRCVPPAVPRQPTSGSSPRRPPPTRTRRPSGRRRATSS